MTTICKAQERSENWAIVCANRSQHKFGTDFYQWVFDMAYDVIIQRAIEHDRITHAKYEIARKGLP